MKNKTVILLLSGGIDSTTLLAKLSIKNFEIVAISFDYGQKHRIELNFAKKNAEKYRVKEHHIIKLNDMLFKSSALVNPEIEIETHKKNDLTQGPVNAYVPFRNLIFISYALCMAETMKINEIYLAFNRDDGANFWDCKIDFVKGINSIANLNTNIKIKTPFINLSKREIIKLARQLNVDLSDTFTCYQPIGTMECGHCLSCLKKQKAIKNT